MVQDPGDWIEKGSFVLPLFPRELDLDPLFASLLHCAAFLEFSSDDVVDPDSAVEAMEHVAAYFSALDLSAKESLQDQIGRAVRHAKKNRWPEDVVDFVEDFLENFGAVPDEDTD